MCERAAEDLCGLCKNACKYPLCQVPGLKNSFPYTKKGGIGRQIAFFGLLKRKHGTIGTTFQNIAKIAVVVADDQKFRK